MVLRNETILCNSFGKIDKMFLIIKIFYFQQICLLDIVFDHGASTIFKDGHTWITCRITNFKSEEEKKYIKLKPINFIIPTFS